MSSGLDSLGTWLQILVGLSGAAAALAVAAIVILVLCIIGWAVHGMPEIEDR